MNELLVITLLVVSIFVLLGCGVWVGLTLAGTAWIGMEIFSSRPAGDAMAVTIWGASSSWTLTALPLFLWMGEILFRTRLSGRPVQRPGPLAEPAAWPVAAHERDRLRHFCGRVGFRRLPPAPPSAR